MIYKFSPHHCQPVTEDPCADLKAIQGIKPGLQSTNKNIIFRMEFRVKNGVMLASFHHILHLKAG